MAAIERLGPYSGTYLPDYQLSFYRDGNPKRPIRDVNLRSVTSIQTAKQISEVAGTFAITLKDRAARLRISEMDTCLIKLRGHTDPYTTVFKGVVDEVRSGGSADVYAASEDTVITGRCPAKYLQITSLFLPVWDPQGILPTALIFGLGDVTKKGADSKGKLTPRAIFRYLVRNYTYGERDAVGVSGIPNSRFWLDHLARFEDIDFEVPFIQFDEDSMATALKRFEIQGFTEAWVDELGRVVYRQPQWDAAANYSIPTESLKTWSLSRSDLEVATYVEVIPAGDPGIDSATAQALRAGRAPVPSAYVNASGADAKLGENVSKEYVIETDSKGKVTAKGARNPYYRKQRRLGMRPQQITSPLLFSQEQAQAQAEGLLDFFSRYTKTASVTIPLEPGVRLGRNARMHGPIDGIDINRTYYLEGVSHEYVEGSHADTTLTFTHGRDPWDPKWGRISLPKFDPADLALDGGVLDTSSGGDASISAPALQRLLHAKATPKHIIDSIVLPVARACGINVTAASVEAANHGHSTQTQDGNLSDHAGPGNVRWAADMSNGIKTPEERKLATALAALFDIPWHYPDGGLRNATAFGYRFQLIHLNYPKHDNHVHFGLHRV